MARMLTMGRESKIKETIVILNSSIYNKRMKKFILLLYIVGNDDKRIKGGVGYGEMHICNEGKRGEDE